MAGKATDTQVGVGQCLVKFCSLFGAVEYYILLNFKLPALCLELFNDSAVANNVQIGFSRVVALVILCKPRYYSVKSVPEV